MAKYAYAPLSIEDDRRRRTSGAGGMHSGLDSPSHHAGHSGGGDDQLVQERMPLCIGVCVLLAIVYVLSRTGGNDPALMKVDPNHLNNNNSTMIVSNNPSSSSNSNNNNIRSPNAVPSSPVATTTASSNSMTTPVASTAGEEESNAGTNAGTNPSFSGQQSQVQGSSTGTSFQQDSSSMAAFKDGSGSATSSGTTLSETTDSTSSTGTTEDCNCPSTAGLDTAEVVAAYRTEALSRAPAHILECAAEAQGDSNDACHLSRTTRYAALQQKGATLWMTGCSGAGKTTIGTALEDKLVKLYGKHVYRLDGDFLRTGINRDLGFSASDRAESVRRTGELATLFSDAGVITLVGLISPYRKDRDAVRQRHEEQGIPFYEVFLDVPVEELKNRDPKDMYAKAEAGEIQHFTCIDDPYEEPLHPEITLKTHELTVEQSATILFRQLERDGILMGPPKVAPPGLPNPDGDQVVDLHVPPHLQKERYEEAAQLPKVLITDLELNWLQTIGEGWASPLKGFMREGTLLETLHFNSILVDPFNLTGNVNRLESATDFAHFSEHPAPTRVSMSVPITLSCTSYTRDAIQGVAAVALVTQMGQTVAILRNPEVYENRKEEIATRMFGVIDPEHPYIQEIYKGGDYLIGGEVELLDRIVYNDGLDKWRKTAKELMEEFRSKGADTVYAFQTRNPTHAGHAYLMRSAGEDLRQKGYQKPILWLSPLGGWTKPDDVPLDVRVHQHEEVLGAGLTHPGGLDPETTVMAIWPAPMVYAGPTEVQFHAKSRRSAGASFFVVGRDPAGMKGSPHAIAHPDDDLYDGNHGRYVLQNSPGIGDMQMLSFVKVMYDITDNVMKEPDPLRPDDFISISGSKMRLLARNGAHLCSPDDIPTDLVEANCVPSGFMVPKGWDMVVDYYSNIASNRWTPWSRPRVEAPAAKRTKAEGQLGTLEFVLGSEDYDSWWHDIPLRPTSNSDAAVINMVTEIPMYYTPKMEVQKGMPNNPITQDHNKDGSPRYYTYGVPFFNYGLIPQTWEDPGVKSTEGYGGDNDPLDVMELGSVQLKMGSITPCRILGSLELIDEGETDHKILCVSLEDPDANRIHSLEDLEQVKPGHMARLKDWLKRYKTRDGKPENSLASETPKTVQEAVTVVDETHQRWRVLCGHDSTEVAPPEAEDFWLASPGCRGE